MSRVGIEPTTLDAVESGVATAEITSPTVQSVLNDIYGH